MSGERRYLLDTNALIALGEGDAGLVETLERADFVATSVVCKVEYLSGIVDNAEGRVLFEQMLRGIEVVDLRNADAELIDETIGIRAANGYIKLPDAIVMASANATGSILLTRDRQLLNAGLCKARAF